ncbi:MAG: hypothetical protein N2450_00745 [bacterium]|nr:hypothetical protein [bacterium]
MNGIYLDIGTQTTLWMIGKMELNAVHPIQRGYWTNGFGLGLDQHNEIPSVLLEQEEARIRSLLSEKHQWLEDETHSGLFAGTAVIRNSRNGSLWMMDLEQKFGYPTKVLSPDEEALAAWHGAHSRVGDPSLRDYDEVIIDLGGGSTEFIWKKNGKVVSYSVQIGASVLTRKFQKDPLTTRAYYELIDLYSNDFLPLQSALPKTTMPRIVGGTAVAFSSLLVGALVEDPYGLNCTIVQKSDFYSIYDQLVTLPEEERKQIPGIPLDRVKTLPSGATILRFLFELFQWEGFRIEPRGVLFGLPFLVNSTQPID